MCTPFEDEIPNVVPALATAKVCVDEVKPFKVIVVGETAANEATAEAKPLTVAETDDNCEVKATIDTELLLIELESVETVALLAGVYPKAVTTDPDVTVPLPLAKATQENPAPLKCKASEAVQVANVDKRTNELADRPCNDWASLAYIA